MEFAHQFFVDCINPHRMKKGILLKKSTDLAIEIIRYYKWLVAQHKEFVLSKQILRSGTSIGANVREANYGASIDDFINKMQIALKEASETEYWLYLLEESDYFDNSFLKMKSDLDEVKRMLVSTINTAKKRRDEMRKKGE